MKKIVATSVIFMSIVQNSFADGTSIGTDATFAANLVRRGDVSKCIQQIESDKRASAFIKDIRVVNKELGTYEVALNLMNIDIMRGFVDLVLTPKTVTDPWGQSIQTYECNTP